MTSIPQPPLGPPPSAPPPTTAVPAKDTGRRKALLLGLAALTVVGLTAAAFFVGRMSGDPTGSDEYRSQSAKLDTAVSRAEAAEEELGQSSDKVESLTGELNDAQAQVDALVGELPPEAGAGPALSDGVAIAPRNIRIGVKTRSKECFGSAGCNVTVQIDPDYAGNQDVSSGSWEITYEIRGGEDPVVETMTLEDGTFSFPEEQFLQTTSSNSKLTAVATRVDSLD
ncbi:hypothetical protein NSI01_03640 [Pimelobacter simplex]|nr:hypothetical protein NSI01_03640 [Pimelobacter simplex]